LPEDIKYCDVPLKRTKSFVYDHVHIVWNEQIRFHQHAEWEMSYIIKGSGIRIIGDIAETFTSGEIILVPPNIPHCWSFDEHVHDEEGKIENITIIFPESLFDKCLSAFPETELSVSMIRNYHKQAVKFEGITLQKLQAIMVLMLNQNDIEQLSSLIEMFSVIASAKETNIAGYLQNTDKNTERMQTIWRYILNNFQHEISLDDITSYIGMNKASFCTFFKNLNGKSFFTFLNEYRIDSSCLMLRETRMPIMAICYAVGFNDVPHFNRTFKKLKGETPKRYRAKFQN